MGHVWTSAEQNTAESPHASETDADYATLRQNLSFDPTSIDELQNRSGLTIEQLSSMLLLMELRGEVEAMSGGRYSLIA